MRTFTALVLGLALSSCAWAFSLSDMSDRQATDGLRQTLAQAATEAVTGLGKPDGFLGNPKVKIPLPDQLARMESLLRTLGLGAQADELVTTMNRAAESAVSEAKPILVNAVKKMSIADAKGILTGGDDAATQYFRRTTGDEMRAKFRPVVAKTVNRLGVVQRYDALASKAGSLGLKAQSTEDYVTDKSLDGLWLMVAEREKALRQNPVSAVTSIARQVLGALK